VIALKADHAVAIVGQVLELVGELVVRRLVRLLREVARKRPHARGLERHALLLRQGFARGAVADHRAVKRPAGKWQRKAGGKKIAATQWVIPVGSS